MLGDDPPERSGIGCSDGFPLVEQGCAAGSTAGRTRCTSVRRPIRRRTPPSRPRPGGCRRCSPCSSARPPRDRRCRARRLSVALSYPTCRGCRGDRSRRPVYTRLVWPGPLPLPSRRSRPFRRVARACGRCTMTQLSGLCDDSSTARSSNGLYSITRLPSMPHEADTTTLGRPSSRRIASSCGANPPKTTECTAPSRAQASMAITASGIMGI